jgi:hypothetical protein
MLPRKKLSSISVSSFVQREIVERWSGDGLAIKILDHDPVVDVTLALDGVALDPSAYVVDETAAMIHLLTRSFDTGVMNWVATYTAGYDVQGRLRSPE